MAVNPNDAKVNCFYQTDGKTLLPHLFDTEAEKIARTFWGDKQKIKDGKPLFNKQGEPIMEKHGVTSTQLRKFFDEVKRYDRLLSMPNQSWEKQEAYIRMLKSKVAYAVARVKGDKKYYEHLSEFVNSGINCVKNADDYHVFTALFEAIYGFYYEHAPDGNN